MGIRWPPSLENLSTGGRRKQFRFQLALVRAALERNAIAAPVDLFLEPGDANVGFTEEPGAGRV
jgi:hypothetical protein